MEGSRHYCHSPDKQTGNSDYSDYSDNSDYSDYSENSKIEKNK